MKPSKGLLLFLVGLVVGICIGIGGTFAFNHFTADVNVDETSNTNSDTTENKDETSANDEQVTEEPQTSFTSEDSVQGDSTAVNTVNTNTDSNAGTGLFASYEWPESEMNTYGVPKPSFDKKPSMVNISKYLLMVRYEDISMEEATGYIEALRNSAYVFDVQEDRSNATYNFRARNSEDILTSATLTVRYSAQSEVSPASLEINIMHQ